MLGAKGKLFNSYCCWGWLILAWVTVFKQQEEQLLNQIVSCKIVFIHLPLAFLLLGLKPVLWSTNQSLNSTFHFSALFKEQRNKLFAISPSFVIGWK